MLVAEGLMGVEERECWRYQLNTVPSLASQSYHGQFNAIAWWGGKATFMTEL